MTQSTRLLLVFAALLPLAACNSSGHDAGQSFNAAGQNLGHGFSQGANATGQAISGTAKKVGNSL